MAKIMKMSGSGLIVNRHAKGSKIEIALDPSPGEFLSDARRKKERIKLLIVPGNGDTDPIEILASPKVLVLKVEMAQIPPDRLADLEALVTEEQDVHVVVEYKPGQEDLPFEEDAAAEDTDAIQEASGADSGDTVEFKVPFTGIKKCKLHGKLTSSPAGWLVKYEAEIGNYSGAAGTEHMDPVPTQKDAWAHLRFRMDTWLDGLEFSGTVDNKRAMTARAENMRNQIDEYINAKIGEMTE